MAKRDNTYDKKHYEGAFGLQKHFYVTSGTPLEAEARTIIVLEAVSGLTMTDELSLNGSTSIPGALPVGIQLNGAFSNIEVQDGVLLCILA